MTTKHTPGPWYIRKGYKDVWIFTEDKRGGQEVAQVNGDTLQEGTTEAQEADARLIAAAPDMAEALQYAREALIEIHERDCDNMADGIAGCPCDIAKAWRKTNAALEKAGIQ